MGIPVFTYVYYNEHCIRGLTDSTREDDTVRYFENSASDSRTLLQCIFRVVECSIFVMIISVRGHYACNGKSTDKSPSRDSR